LTLINHAARVRLQKKTYLNFDFYKYLVIEQNFDLSDFPKKLKNKLKWGFQINKNYSFFFFKLRKFLLTYKPFSFLISGLILSVGLTNKYFFKKINKFNKNFISLFFNSDVFYYFIYFFLNLNFIKFIFAKFNFLTLLNNGNFFFFFSLLSPNLYKFYQLFKLNVLGNFGANEVLLKKKIFSNFNFNFKSYLNFFNHFFKNFLEYLVNRRIFLKFFY
jgi:hypothetical protein